MGIHIGFEDIEMEKEYPDSQWDSVRYAVDNVFVDKMHLTEWETLGDGVYGVQYFRPKSLDEFEVFIHENFEEDDKWRVLDMLKIFKENEMAFAYISY